MFGQQDANGTNTAQPAAAGGLNASDLQPVGGMGTASNTPTRGAHDTPSAPAVDTPVDGDQPAALPDTDQLLGLKQQALQQLTPLLDHLDQSPEEKFRTVMMLIQASDNPGLINLAYDAASQMGDEKQRAQALLDIVNEINYFTQRDSVA